MLMWSYGVSNDVVGFGAMVVCLIIWTVWCGAKVVCIVLHVDVGVWCE